MGLPQFLHVAWASRAFSVFVLLAITSGSKIRCNNAACSGHVWTQISQPMHRWLEKNSCRAVPFFISMAWVGQFLTQAPQRVHCFVSMKRSKNGRARFLNRWPSAGLPSISLHRHWQRSCRASSDGSLTGVSGWIVLLRDGNCAISPRKSVFAFIGGALMAISGTEVPGFRTKRLMDSIIGSHF